MTPRVRCCKQEVFEVPYSQRQTRERHPDATQTTTAALPPASLRRFCRAPARPRARSHQRDPRRAPSVARPRPRRPPEGAKEPAHGTTWTDLSWLPTPSATPQLERRPRTTRRGPVVPSVVPRMCTLARTIRLVQTVRNPIVSNGCGDPASLPVTVTRVRRRHRARLGQSRESLTGPPGDPRRRTHGCPGRQPSAGEEAPVWAQAARRS